MVKSSRLEDIERFEKEKEARAREVEEEKNLYQLLCNPKPIEEGNDNEILIGVRDRFYSHLIGDSDLYGQPTLFKALKMAAHENDMQIGAFVRFWLEKSGQTPDPYHIKMARFNMAFFNEALKEGKKLSPCVSLYPKAPEEEAAGVEAMANEMLQILPAPLNSTIFSVDDEDVQEIDDALSVERIDDDRIRVGVHIAAPGLFIPEESIIHRDASFSCTTVYQPDMKWTMLPVEVVDLFSLKAKIKRPAVSTYSIFSIKDFTLLETEVRLEAVTLSENMTYAGLEELLEGEFFPELNLLDSDSDRVHAWFERDPGEFPWNRKDGLPEEFDYLVPLARRLFCDRCKQGAQLFNRTEHRIKVTPDGQIKINERRRNSIVEGVVSELMIHTNGMTADRLAGADIPAIYRTQRLISVADGYRSKADLSVVPGEHAGLGGALYCWSTSPLRRYADLLNQRQLGTLIGGKLPLFEDTSELLVRAKQTEFQNKTANDHQRRMEKYWTLKYLEQHAEELHPVELIGIRDRMLIDFKKLPLKVPMDPSQRIIEGPLLFRPEEFDFHELNVTGILEEGS